MHVPPPPSTLAPGRSPGRLRSKTSDLSDLLHGRSSSSKPSEPTVPSLPVPSLGTGITPTKSKGKLAGFLARKRKSGGLALGGGHDALVRKDEGADINYPSPSQEPASSRPSSILPPLNVSPTSFGSSFASATHASQPPRNSSGTSSLLSPVGSSSSAGKYCTSAIPFRGPSAQKPTSFEVSRPFNITHTATATNMAIVNGSTSRIPGADLRTAVLERKPTITISAPPTGKDAKNNSGMLNAPRPAPAPPSSVASSTSPSKPSKSSKEAGVARKFGFSHHRKDKDDIRVSNEKSKDKDTSFPNPTISLSPMLPPKMHFPLPPKTSVSLNASESTNGAQIVPALADAFQSLSPAPSSLATISPHTTAASDVTDGDVSPSRIASGTPMKPIRPTSLIIPVGDYRQRTYSVNTISSSLTARSPPSSPSSSTLASTATRPSFPPSSRLRSTTNGTSNRVSSQRYSYSYRSTNGTTASPASPPPCSPLPSPPVSTLSFPGSNNLSSGEEVEIEAGWSTDASTRLGYGGWSTDASTRVSSLAGYHGKKGGLAAANNARVRANTITSHGPGVQRVGTSTRQPASSHSQLRHTSGVSSGDDTTFDSTASGGRVPTRKSAGNCLSGLSYVKGKEKSKPNVISDSDDQSSRTQSQVRPRVASQSSQRSSPLPSTQEGSSMTLAREEDSGLSSGLRVAHETFVRILQEKHAAEKAELLRRIERLKKEVRKREREIKGLRWLVMNPTNGDGSYASLLALEEQLAIGRLRPSLKASELSAISMGSDVTRPRTSSGMDKLSESNALTSPTGSTEESLMELQSEVSDLIAPAQLFTSPSCSRESKAWSGSPDSVRPTEVPHEREALLPATRHTKRTSSPLLPTAHGLGFVDADIPSIPSGSEMSFTSLAGATSIPSLTSSSTNSASALFSSSPSSAILNESSPPVVDPRGQQDSETLEKIECGAPKVLKRASITSSATSTYAANLKIGMSPLIEQVLDRAEVRASAVDATKMDDALKRLYAFGSENK